jgi:hypothetical protein
MVGNSDSRTSTTTEEYIFNNADYAGGGGESASLANNINLARSELSIGDVIQTDHGAVAGGVNIAKTGIATTGESFKELLKTSEQLVGDGYDGLLGTQEFAKDALSRAVNFASSANQGISEQLDQVLSYANASTRSDTSQAFENIAKWGLIASGTVAAVWLLNRKG